MEGFVMLVNPQERMAAVKIDDGSYSAVQYFEDLPLRTGDYLKGNLQKIGAQIIENLTAGESQKVYIQDAKGLVAAKTKLIVKKLAKT